MKDNYEHEQCDVPRLMSLPLFFALNQNIALACSKKNRSTAFDCDKRNED